MKNIDRTKLAIIVLAILAVCAIIVVAYFAPLQKSKYVHIVSEIGISQGAVENNTGMETIKVQGTFWNDGNLVPKIWLPQ
jgi:membrane protein implicated in regulation of membrane protease activity